MAGEDGAPTPAGLDIMSSTSTHLEQGFAKILRWISNEFRSLGGSSGSGVQLDFDDVDVHPLMRESVAWLKKRPELLTEALTILSEARQASLLSAFITALTRGGPSGLPRPIELHAHDPMRYVGDMLAWVHQAIAAEREFLEGLFGIKSDGRMVGSARDFVGKKGEEEEWIQELMDLAVSKLCVPLKVHSVCSFSQEISRSDCGSRTEYSRPSARRRASSCRTRLRTFYSSTSIRCRGLLVTKLF